jgi:hypothetical protein
MAGVEKIIFSKTFRHRGHRDHRDKGKKEAKMNNGILGWSDDRFFIPILPSFHYSMIPSFRGHAALGSRCPLWPK